MFSGRNEIEPILSTSMMKGRRRISRFSFQEHRAISGCGAIGLLAATGPPRYCRQMYGSWGRRSTFVTAAKPPEARVGWSRVCPPLWGPPVSVSGDERQSIRRRIAQGTRLQRPCPSPWHPVKIEDLPRAGATQDNGRLETAAASAFSSRWRCQNPRSRPFPSVGGGFVAGRAGKSGVNRR